MEAFKDQRLEEIVRVIGVGERRVGGDLALTLLSVEIYRDGFVAQFHLVGGRPTEGASGMPGFPQFTAAASDDRGTIYRERPYGGSGGGNSPGRVSWRMASAFAPALGEGARALTLRVGEVAWSTIAEGEMRASHTTAGPWEFVVGL